MAGHRTASALRRLLTRIEASWPSHAPRASVAGLLCCVVLAAPALSQAWWNTNWTRRLRLTFDNSTRPETLQSFPILVALDGSTIDYSRTRNAGQDIRFVDSDGSTVLAHEIERWNEAGTSYVWVKVPAIDASSDTDHIWMYYGHAEAGNGENAANVWTAGYVAVWHLHDDRLDSTSSGNTLTDYNTTTGAAGRVAGGQGLGTGNDMLYRSDPPSLRLANAVTISAWIKGSSWGTGGNVNTIAHKGRATPNYKLAVRDGHVVLCLNQSDAGGFAGDTSLNTGQWYHVVGTWDGSDVGVYVDGQPDFSTPGSHSSPLTTDTWYIFAGEWWDSGFYDPFDGTLDEVRIASVGRSAAWIEAQHASMTGGLVGFGAEEGAPSAPWHEADVGSPSIQGGTLHWDDAFTVHGDGSDIWGFADSFQFVYQEVTGDCEIIARVASQEAGVDDDAKAAVMIRANTDGSQHADAYNVMLTHNQRETIYLTQRSASTGGNSVVAASTPCATPYWLRLVRLGDVFTGYASPDPGTSPWQQVGQITVTLPADVFVGLAVTSHDSGTRSTVVFDNVTVTVVPGAFALLLPLDDATGVPVEAALDWGNSAGAATYALRIDDDSDFSTPLVDESGLASSDYHVGVDVLSAGTTYYWRVTAQNSVGNLPASNNDFSFTTVDRPADYLGGGCGAPRTTHLPRAGAAALSGVLVACVVALLRRARAIRLGARCSPDR